MSIPRPPSQGLHPTTTLVMRAHQRDHATHTSLAYPWGRPISISWPCRNRCYTWLRLHCLGPHASIRFDDTPPSSCHPWTQSHQKEGGERETLDHRPRHHHCVPFDPRHTKYEVCALEGISIFYSFNCHVGAIWGCETRYYIWVAGLACTRAIQNNVGNTSNLCKFSWQ